MKLNLRIFLFLFLTLSVIITFLVTLKNLNNSKIIIEKYEFNTSNKDKFNFNILKNTSTTRVFKSKYESPVKIERAPGIKIDERYLEIYGGDLSPIDWLNLAVENSEKILNLQNSYFFQKKKILLYNSFEHLQDLEIKCPKNAEFLEDLCQIHKNNWSEEVVDETDAVILEFNLRNTGDESQKISNYNDIIKIFYTLESPYSSYLKLIGKKTFFASYWKGADFYTPYDKWEKNVSNSTSMELNSNFNYNYAKGRKKLTFILVSNCHPQNDRMYYVNELKSFANVDVYGECGDRDCREPDCNFEKLSLEYKFYLAFENANCRDYITEKFTNALKNNLIPIVLGASYTDLRSFAPPNSFIHVEEYESPKHLADYLTLLDLNDDLYNQYFQWKKSGSFVKIYFFCQVCSMLYLNELSTIYPKRKKDFTWGDFSVNQDICLQPGLWYWNFDN